VRQALLDPENSAALRDRLVREIADISTAEAGAEWARSALAAKNTLTASDARLVQLAFKLRLSALPGDPEGTQNELQSTLAATDAEPSSSAPELPNSEQERIDRHSRRPRLGSIDKSVLRFSGGTATRPTSSSWRPGPASSASENPWTRITCGLRKYGRSGGRSAMNSPFRCAGCITAKSIGRATRRDGGPNWALMPWPLR